MKKLLFLSLLLILFITKSFCQLDKKIFLIGGSASFINSNSDVGNGNTIKNYRTELSSNIGYFVIDKLVTGLKPGFSNGTSKQFGVRTTTSLYLLGPFVRYYVLKKENKANIFSELNYQYGITTTNFGDNTKVNYFLSNLGCAVFFNSNVAIEFTIGYSTINNVVQGKLNSIIAGVGFQFHLEK